jgi:hypothetical protein
MARTCTARRASYSQLLPARACRQPHTSGRHDLRHVRRTGCRDGVRFRTLRVRACVRPQLANTDPAHRRPLPADPAASAAAYANAPASTASATSATSAAPDDCTASAASCCATSAASCCAASATSVLDFFDESGCSETFLVEDIERRQSDVRNFLLIERNFGKRCVVLRRYVRYRHGC